MLDFNTTLQEAIHYHLQSQIEKAYLLYQDLLELNPSHPVLLQWAGLMDFQLNRFEEALRKLYQALTALPQELLFFCHNSLGNVLASYSELGQAKIHYEQALTLKPDFGAAASNLGNVLRCLNQHQEALKAYQTSLTLTPTAELYFQIGNIYHEQGDIVQAESHYLKALELNPDYSDPHFFLALIREKQGDDVVAQAEFKQAFKTNLMAPITCNEPNLTQETLEYHYHLAQQQPLSERLKAYSKLHISIYTFPDLSRQDHFNYFKRWDQGHHFKAEVTSYHHKTLKVAYISPDFCQTSPAKVLLPLFKHYNPENIKVYAYSDVQFPDQQTQQFKELAQVWRDIHNWTDEEVIEQLKVDEIDILVDLAGHTRRNRLPVFARKPVAIQVTGLGFASTTALEHMDYCFSDPILTPPSLAQVYSEKLFYLGTSLCWSAPNFEVPITEPPCTKQTDQIIFGSGNHLSKLNNQVIQVWAKILKALPQALLYLKAEEFNEPQARFLYRYRFQEEGIDPGRILFFGKTTYPKHLEFYNSLDIALDPFPYQGGITSCDTLWMGVPLITLGIEGRLGASLLNLTQQSEFIAKTKEEYIQLALLLAQQPKKIQYLKRTLRSSLLESRICNGKAFCQEVEQAYQCMRRMRGINP